MPSSEQVLHDLYYKVDLPPVRPVVTRVERYIGRCLSCGGVIMAPVPEGLEPGTPFSVNILALAIYLRFTHAISCQRLRRLAVPALVCPTGQRRRAGCHVPACQALLRQRGRGDPGPIAPFA